MRTPTPLLVALLLAGCPTTSTEAPPPRDVALACADTCDGYASCGCEQRCSDWCDSYMAWELCEDEIAALVRCAATHPDPCSWNDEEWAELTCQGEVAAFGSCSGNDFFPLPGAPQVCQEG